ncbi:GntR family transcriptional regulator [Sphingomonas faeni]|uniref:GntR family transcriptional regulator n=1 Tax=Sphingomonas faeni TaxID=185950 RepID=UPI0027864687|nr:GntR family transcriptional regulator [Sphingomonas faeni]MDQ0839213.1 DNA-binding GntR family transcriptional regulator [Sphingomonas faeni]
MKGASQVDRVRRHVLDELRTGLLRPGSAISVQDAAATLRTSATPVREALERLVGEGIVDVGVKRQGFAIPRYGTRDLSDLHRLLEVLGHAAFSERRRSATASAPLTGTAAQQPAAAVEDTFRVIAASAENHMLSAAIRRTSLLLTPYRRAEPTIVPNWLDDLNRLRESIATGRDGARALRAFTKARISHATELAEQGLGDIRDIYQV